MDVNMDCEGVIGKEVVELCSNDLGFNEGVTNVDDELRGVSSTNQLKGVECGCGVMGVNEVMGELIEPPRVGMIFESWELVEAYYKRYGMQQGFGISRVAAAYKTAKGSENVRRAVTWGCECYGKPHVKERREAKKRAKELGISNGMIAVEVSQGKRKSKKCDCTAMVYASLNVEGKWELKKVVLDHLNHNPSLTKAMLTTYYEMVGFAETQKRRQIWQCNDTNDRLHVAQILGGLAMEKDGVQNMQKAERRLRIESDDATAMMDFIERMQQYDQNFFHEQRLDYFGVLQDIIWVDARSKAAYEEFGDVVYFDTTYLTNEYEVPLVNFVGVNHHGQPILLGCAVVSRENVDTYAWVFRQWLMCMGGKAPNAFLTDEGPTVRKAVAEVFQGTHHRWCIWHILQKLPKKLGMYGRYQELENELKELIYESLTIEEFESGWVRVVDKYALGDHDWLHSLYDKRAMWVPAFMKDIFLAGMKTTHRDERLNSFFDDFMTKDTRLFEFVDKYCAAMEKKVSEEKDEELKSEKYVRKLATGFKAEKIFQEVYTDNKFGEVQRECEKVIYCYGREEGFGDMVVHFMEDRVWVVLTDSNEEVITDRRRLLRVRYNRKSRDVDCDCKLFETHGILCRHCIRVLDHHLLGEIPGKYILRRWRKDVPRKHATVKVAYNDPLKMVELKRHEKMMVAFEPLCESASVAEETMEMVVKGLKDIHLSVNEWLGKRSVSSVGDNDLNEVQTVIDGFMGSSVQSQMAPSDSSDPTQDI